jgi:inhibitor of cysteine peptidase
MEKVQKALFLGLLFFAALALIASLPGCAPLNPANNATQPPAVTEPGSAPDPDQPVSSADTPAAPDPGIPPVVTEPQPVNESKGEGEGAIIEALDVLMLESFPVQVRASLSGSLRDGCTSIARIEVLREGNTFRIRVITLRPPDRICTQQLVPFDTSVALDVEGLPAGEYVVRAGDLSRSFSLGVDNVLPGENGCQSPEGGQSQVTSDRYGYCFLVPEGFQPAIPAVGGMDVHVRGPARSQAQPPALAELFVNVGPYPDGADLLGIVNSATGGATGVEMIWIDGQEAALVRDAPGAAPGTALIFALREGQAYILTFQPVDAAAAPEVELDQEQLLQDVVASWTWGD